MRQIWICWLMVLALVVTATPTGAHEELSDGHFELVDESGQVILETGLVVEVGDQYLAEDNRLYEVTAVQGGLARCRLVETVDLTATRPVAWWRRIWPGSARVIPAQKGRPLVGIYHTHGAESFVPTQGTASVTPAGGIVSVADAMAAAFERQGFEVVRLRDAHLPHDSRAYERSRRTALQILKRRPLALFDVHRDTAPASAYEVEVQGNRASKVMLVIGRQNPNRSANLEFAKHIKRVADERKPGLIKGIFFGKGKYNQDLGPRVILLEVGTYRIDQASAQRGAMELAELMPAILTDVDAEYRAEGRSGWTTALWLIVLVLTIAGAFLVLSSGGIPQAREKIKQFISREFRGDLFGRRRGPRNPL
ncbi:MAG: stage II sporulation protein P [Bacillota bacterium]